VAILTGIAIIIACGACLWGFRPITAQKLPQCTHVRNNSVVEPADEVIEDLLPPPV